MNLLRALATAGLCCVDWTAIAAVFVERQQEIERDYRAGADESIDTEEVMAAACSVFGYEGEVQGVYFEHGQWWAWVWPEWPDRSGETQAWSMVDASPGDASVTRPDGRVCRVSFELV